MPAALRKAIPETGISQKAGRGLGPATGKIQYDAGCMDFVPLGLFLRMPWRFYGRYFVPARNLNNFALQDNAKSQRKPLAFRAALR